MLRETSPHAMDWCEKTMSVIRERQFEACQRRLSVYPGVNLFSPTATDTDAQALYEKSYFPCEDLAAPALVTLDTLRARVLALLPLEAMCLSAEEQALTERMLIGGGSVELTDEDAIGAAESLVSRLWASMDSGGGRLTLPDALEEPLLSAFAQADFAKTRDNLLRYDAIIGGLLYIAGFLHFAQPTELFEQEVAHRADAQAHAVATRYLKASFEYMTDENGELILLHPGLADPDRLMAEMSRGDMCSLELTQDMLAGGMNGLLPEEEPLHEELRGALARALRPEYEPQEAAEDLRMLAKQGVSLPEMETVMDCMLGVLPTPRMKSALSQLYLRTPHWLGMRAGLQH